MEFLELLETINREKSDAAAVFQGEGRNVARSPKDPTYLSKLAFFTAALAEGKRWKLEEAMSTSDFPLLMGDVIDRMMLGSYREAPSVWRNFCKLSRVSDFRNVKRFGVQGATSPLSEVGQFGPYPERKLSEESWTYAVKKHGAKLGLAWEMLVNDDLSAFTDIVQRFGKAARATESLFVANLYCDAAGPDATLYAVGNSNIVSGNPGFGISGLTTGLTALGAQKDSEGNPIVITAVELVVPSALEIPALNVLNATQIITNNPAYGGDVSALADTLGLETRLQVANWMQNRLHLSVDPYIGQVATSNEDTSWFLFANPNENRPALEVAFLRGYEEPQVFVKTPNSMRVGAGSANPTDGDFDNDSVEYKVRHVFGGAQIDPKTTVASNGSGS